VPETLERPKLRELQLRRVQELLRFSFGQEQSGVHLIETVRRTTE
jgi:hypothetical protein